ncbi:MAG TPA: tRNA uracil 4-sulfurtransferase ThiI [Clostridia bacterium]|jgi:thiamine biosynthesis protein ThiI|nr:tRNA uracil 4-sulfurtransferase ThiI [Clostridia bacterium]
MNIEQYEYNCILIRQGEIFLKGKNRNKFESLLIKNIKQKLKAFKCTFTSSQNRIYVEDFNKEDLHKIIVTLSKTFGIVSLSKAIKVSTDIDKIIDIARQIVIPLKGTFRVTVKRADKKVNKTSTEIAAYVGGKILEHNANLKVDLHNYDHNVSIDIRENGFTYIFTTIIPGVSGLPVGCSGSGILLLSGGIDSPVAGYYMSKRGLKLSGIHFYSFPYTSESALQKVRDLSKILSEYNNGFELYIVPFTDIQIAIRDACPSEFTITIMRRFMMRIAQIIAKTNNANTIVTGESLGQVASQTIKGMVSTDQVLDEDILVLRPLIGFDKEETIDISKSIGSFDISILPYDDCCTLFVPKSPSINPNLKSVIERESVLDIEYLVNKAISDTVIEHF